MSFILLDNENIDVEDSDDKDTNQLLHFFSHFLRVERKHIYHMKIVSIPERTP